MARYRIAVGNDLRLGLVYDVFDLKGDWLAWSETVDGAMWHIRNHIERG